MTQIVVPKVHGWVAFGPSTVDSIMAPKVHGWVLLVPGDDGGTPETPADRQGFVYGQRVRRV